MIADILKRTDPRGYYVVLLSKTKSQERSIDVILKAHKDRVIVEDLGDVIAVRTRSRRVARKIASLALKWGLLETG